MEKIFAGCSLTTKFTKVSPLKVSSYHSDSDSNSIDSEANESQLIIIVLHVYNIIPAVV